MLKKSENQELKNSECHFMEGTVPEVMRKYSNQHGFTLLELLAVLVILAALTVITIPIFTNKNYEAKIVAQQATEEAIKKQTNAYSIQENPSLPQTDIIPSMVTAGYLKETPVDPVGGGNYKISLDTSGIYRIISSYLGLNSASHQYAELPAEVGDFSNESGGNADFVMEVKADVNYVGVTSSNSWITKQNTAYSGGGEAKGWYMGIFTSNTKFQISAYANDGSGYAALTTNATVGTHIEKVERVDSTIYFYVDEVLIEQTTSANMNTGLNASFNSPTVIGRDWSGDGGYWNCYANNNIHYIKIWKNTTDTTKQPTYAYYFTNAGVDKTVINYGTAGSSGDGQAYNGALQVK